jgi:molybdate transport system substrate-binding protein
MTNRIPFTTTSRALAALTLAVGFGLSGCGRKEAGAPLLCYVGGTMRPVMERLAAIHEKETGQRVHIDYAGSGELMIKIEQNRMGDLYVAHDPFQAAIMRRGLSTRGWTVASVKPVIVVPRDNPRNIRGFRDLAQPGMRLVFSHPTYSTAGWIIPIVAGHAEVAAALESNIVSRTRGGGEAANAVGIGTADAAICWDAVAHLRKDKLTVIPIEPDFLPRRDVDAITTATFGKMELDYIRVTVDLLKFSEQPQAAEAFAAFVGSPEAASVWAAFGFAPTDPSRPGPGAAVRVSAPRALHVHCAAGMRKSISVLARDFTDTTGVPVNLALGGSNVLLGQIALNRKGDLYIAGDADYVAMAADKGLVASRRTICHFVPVIMVAQGNPKNIAALADLVRPGLRIAQGDERAAAVGRLTPKLLALNEVDPNDWQRNVVTSSPTVNELGLAIKLGTADAAIVWDVVARDYLDAAASIAIPPEKNICPAVEGAVLTFAKNPEGAKAFLDFLASEHGRAVLSEHGYRVDKP